MIVATSLLTSCVKLLLIPAYRSTDFEVHRNWLAITYSLPKEKWYYENTSEWTLDYPPFFACFEYLMSFIARYFDPNMLVVNNLYYASDMTILFQRLSVIVTDLVYGYGVYRICEVLPNGWKKDAVLPLLLLTNCGLIIVDDIHFQYNGIMYGILLISIAHMMKEKYMWSSFWFTFLLNMKHIYIYLAPAYFIYLLRHYCFSEKKTLNASFSIKVFKHSLQLGSVVIGVFAASFWPFINHLPQVLSRLFPFKRGLCHAYWAPNFWSLYNLGDKFLSILLTKMNLPPIQTKSSLMTGGLVQEIFHSVLPNISPITTMALTILVMLPCLFQLFFLDKKMEHFLRCLILCGMTSFVFGWHVHEKAILMVIIPMSVLSVMEPTDAKFFLLLTTVGHYSLFPLLFPVKMIFVKLLLLIVCSSYAFYSLNKIHGLNACKYSLPMLSFLESVYLLGLGGIFIYDNVIHKLVELDTKLPFLPLMITSCYCSLGVLYCYINYYLYFLYSRKNKNIK